MNIHNFIYNNGHRKLIGFIELHCFSRRQPRYEIIRCSIVLGPIEPSALTQTVIELSSLYGQKLFFYFYRQILGFRLCVFFLFRNYRPPSFPPVVENENRFRPPCDAFKPRNITCRINSKKIYQIRSKQRQTSRKRISSVVRTHETNDVIAVRPIGLVGCSCFQIGKRTGVSGSVLGLISINLSG